MCWCGGLAAVSAAPISRIISVTTSHRGSAGRCPHYTAQLYTQSYTGDSGNVCDSVFLTCIHWGKVIKLFRDNNRESREVDRVVKLIKFM